MSIIKNFFLIIINIHFISTINCNKDNINNNNYRYMKTRERGAGILMHITSLPSNYGIGTLGKEAYNFVDFLVKAKQTYWQMLPIGPTTLGDNPDNPYSPTSSYAGNPYMINLDILISEKLLKEEEVKSQFWGDDKTMVDFRIQDSIKLPILEKAFTRFKPNLVYDKFIAENKNWLDNYALYMALKEKFNGTIWLNWPEDIKKRKPENINYYKKELERKINLIKFIQFKFYEQFNKLKQYCKKNNIKLIGDVPIYVKLDGCDAWTNPEIFQLDENYIPKFISGSPPDFSNPEGTLWYNPCYNWDLMIKDDFKWYINRLKHLGKFFDIIRIDHFQGLVNYWSIPYGASSAKNGKYEKGPGINLINAIHKYLPDIDFILEDLGFLTEETIDLRKKSGFPGMKILQYAFNPYEKSIYLPYFYDKNTVVYPGTHDNEVLAKWQNDISKEERFYCEKYFGLPSGSDLRWPVIRGGMSSVAFLFIAQMQDYIGLGGESRMNVIGVNNGKNFRWRATREQISDNLAEKIGHLTEIYGR